MADPADLKEQFDSMMGNDYRGESLFREPLSRHSSLGIGGPADILVVPADAISLKRCLMFAVEKGFSTLVLGGGTNVLLPDDGYRGMVISLRLFNMKKVVNERDAGVELFVESGVSLQNLINFCAENGYSGLEGLTGIPGSLGGAIAGNTGAYGYEVKDIIGSLVVINHSGMIKRLDRSELSFGYRTSSLTEDSIVLSANLNFRKNDPLQIKARIRGFLDQKKSAQPLSERSAGCVFKNPEGESAGRLIETAGCKGMRVGGMEVSTIHANFFVNKEGGTAADFMQLVSAVKDMVYNRTGFRLETEIRIIRNGN